MMKLIQDLEDFKEMILSDAEQLDEDDHSVFTGNILRNLASDLEEIINKHK